jgi:hypothetical protein
LVILPRTHCTRFCPTFQDRELPHATAPASPLRRRRRRAKRVSGSGSGKPEPVSTDGYNRHRSAEGLYGGADGRRVSTARRLSGVCDDALTGSPVGEGARWRVSGEARCKPKDHTTCNDRGERTAVTKSDSSTFGGPVVLRPMHLTRTGGPDGDDGTEGPGTSAERIKEGPESALGTPFRGIARPHAPAGAAVGVEDLGSRVTAVRLEGRRSQALSRRGQSPMKGVSVHWRQLADIPDDVAAGI